MYFGEIYMKKQHLIIVTMLFIAIILTGYGCSGSKEQKNKENNLGSLQIKAYTLTMQDLPLHEKVVGTVISKNQAMVSPKVMGTIQAMYVKEGDRVKAGQRLAQVDMKDLKPGVDKANAGLQEIADALLELDKWKEELIANQQAAKANFDYASTSNHRMKNLFEQEAISREMFDESNRQYALAAANVAALHAKRKGLEDKKKQLYAKQQQLTADLNMAKTNLGYATIDSPISGIVVKKYMDAGSMAIPGQPIFMVETPEYQFQVAVNESLAPKLHLGDKATVKLEALDQVSEGAIIEINPATDPLSRTQTVKISIPNIANLRSGMYGSASFNIGIQSRLAVPQTAIVERGSLLGVYTLDTDGISRFRLVKTGDTYGDWIEVTGGLQIGDKIIVSDLDKVQEGMAVKSN